RNDDDQSGHKIPSEKGGYSFSHGVYILSQERPALHTSPTSVLPAPASAGSCFLTSGGRRDIKKVGKVFKHNIDNKKKKVTPDEYSPLP
ncbi:MAG: hypothetical protein KJ874_13755, partial [Acidobacteria bacterium]|nr:hypothetical protein [Acidobacteriota bacterium]